MIRERDIEERFGGVMTVMIVLFAAALGAGLLLHVIMPRSGPAGILLEAGLVLLMASPAVRLLLALAERIRRADWTFVVLTAVIALELAIVMWRAAQKL